MKVLCIFEFIPEETKLYFLEDQLADLALAAHNQIIGASDNSEAASALSEALDAVEPVWQSGNNAPPFKPDYGQIEAVVWVGFAM